MTQCKTASFLAATTLYLVTLTASCAQPGGFQEAEAWRDDADAFVARLEAEHENPFFHTPEEDFRQAVLNYKADVSGMTRAERIAGLANLAAIVGDGHTWMPMFTVPFDGLPPGPGFRSLPLRFELFDDGLYVVGATPNYRTLLGGRVISLGDVSAEGALERIMTLLPQDATRFASEFAPEWLMQAELLEATGISQTAETINLSVSLEGQILSFEIAPLGPEAQYNWITSMDGGPSGHEWATAAVQTPLWKEKFVGNWRWIITEGVVYFQINEIRNTAEQTLSELIHDALQAAEAVGISSIVIDLRRCSGGNGNLNDGIVEALTGNAAANQTDHIAVLTGRQTHSAAIMLVSLLEQRTTATFFGQATADRPNHHGETNIFVTPNSHLPIVHASEFYVTSMADDERPYRIPDVSIPYQFLDYVHGEDPILDAAINFLTGDNQ